jgi:hypothetical protein
MPVGKPLGDFQSVPLLRIPGERKVGDRAIVAAAVAENLRGCVLRQFDLWIYHHTAIANVMHRVIGALEQQRATIEPAANQEGSFAA